MQKKTYILDTNILITDPHAVYAFDEHDVAVIDITLEELDNNKNKPGELGAGAREAVRTLNTLREKGNIVNGVQLDARGATGVFRVELNHVKEALPEGWADNKADHRILRACSALKNCGENVILVTNDSVMRLKADIIGIKAEEYKTIKAPDIDSQYKGRRSVQVERGGIDKFYNDGCLPEQDIIKTEEAEYTPLTVNEFLVMKDAVTGASALGRYDGKSIKPLAYANSMPYGIQPRNAGQRFAIEALMAPASIAPLVIIKGGAGTSKTFCALAAGLEQVIGKSERVYRQVLIARPNVKFDEDIGFLKGDEMDKIAPLLRPVHDNLTALMELSGKSKEDGGTAKSAIEYLFESGELAAEALAYFRGRSISRTYVIIDEAQNMSPLQAYGVVSRAGEGSKIVLLGDPSQIDNAYLDSRTNGLSYASDRMKGNPLCWQVTFSGSECVRSRLAEESIKKMSPKGYA